MITTPYELHTLADTHCLFCPYRYVCVCEPGWTGRNCDLNVNECLSNPCVNGGTCRDMTNGYICSCKAGFTGDYLSMPGHLFECISVCRCIFVIFNVFQVLIARLISMSVHPTPA